MKRETEAAGQQKLFVLKFSIREAVDLVNELGRSYVKGPGPAMDELEHALAYFVRTHQAEAEYEVSD